MENLIEKWQQKHSEMLSYYNEMPKLSENEKLFLRSEMKNILEFIEDLKALANSSHENAALPLHGVINMVCPECKSENITSLGKTTYCRDCGNRL